MEDTTLTNRKCETDGIFDKVELLTANIRKSKGHWNNVKTSAQN